MKLKEIDSPVYSIKGNEIFFSNEGLAGLVKAAFNKGAPFRFQVKGFSMYPFIKDGDVVTISPLSNPSVGLGRTVAFINPKTERFTIHRVIGKRANCYLIKGDNIPEEAVLIPRENILGCVTKVERDGNERFLGLGPERFIIAFLSHRRLLPIPPWAGRFIPHFIRRLI